MCSACLPQVGVLRNLDNAITKSEHSKKDRYDGAFLLWLDIYELTYGRPHGAI
jgi:hypothetical protein